MSRSLTRLVTASAAALGLLLSACSGGSDASDASLLGAPDEAGAWPRPGRDMGDSYFTPLDGINAGNVDQLGLAFEFTDFLIRGRTHYAPQSTPVMMDGKLFFSGPWGEAYAIDARTGEQVWMFDTDADGQYALNTCCGVVNRGIAIADGKVFVGALDGYLYALDMNTGEQVWKVDTFYDRHWNYSSTGAPQIAGDVVMIGNAGAEMGARGYVTAYDIETGEQEWRFWAVPGDPKDGPDETPEVTLARETWPEDSYWHLGLGGTAWNGLAYDPETDTAYLGFGNGGPHPAWKRSASGKITDQLFLTSIVAVNAKTGRMKWYYQQTPGDSWDFTATAPMVLADMEIDGENRKVLMQAPKNGMFYVLDRETGELLRADPYTRINWNKGVDMETGRPIMNPDVIYKDDPVLIWPSGAGGHGWQPMAFSPRTGLVYIPVYETGMQTKAEGDAVFKPGYNNQLAEGTFPPFSEEALAGREQSSFEGRLKAWDPKTGEARWMSEPLTFINGGTMVAGDLVFQGTAAGYLDAYDAASGEQVAHIFIGTVMMAAPMTYELDGEQYLAILAGAGGPQGGFFAPDVVGSQYENYQRLIVLKLDGKEIPLPPKRTAAEQSPMPSPIRVSNSTFEHGRELYLEHCSRCHVMGGAVSVYPDLWNMQPATINAFDAIVANGALAYGGMGNFSAQLSDREIAAIKAFVVNDIIARRKGEDDYEGPRSHQTH